MSKLFDTRTIAFPTSFIFYASFLERFVAYFIQQKKMGLEPDLESGLRATRKKAALGFKSFKQLYQSVHGIETKIA